jgi:undecaprenyl pyrophosphate synthase
MSVPLPITSVIKILSYLPLSEQYKITKLEMFKKHAIHIIIRNMRFNKSRLMNSFENYYASLDMMRACYKMYYDINPELIMGNVVTVNNKQYLEYGRYRFYVTASNETSMKKLFNNMIDNMDENDLFVFGW